MSFFSSNKKLKVYCERSFRANCVNLFVWIDDEKRVYETGKISIVKDVITEEIPESTTIATENYFGMTSESAQDLLDELCRIGFKPTFEQDREGLVKTLHKEIEKRDEIIKKLMEEFVYKKREPDQKEKLIEKLMDQFVIKDEQLKFKRSILA